MIELLENEKPIPPEYEEILISTTKKEYELKYSGKQRKEVILNDTLSVPFQPIKNFGDVKRDEWANMLISGDNLQALKHLIKMKNEGKLKNADGSNGVKLVYIDPPFATKQDFMGNQEQKAYQDKIAGAEFIEFIRKRLILIKEVLADSGTIFVHLDWKKGHYIKIILDEIFGEEKFRNEIIWFYRRWTASSNTFQKMHDVILFYSKTGNYTFNKVHVETTEGQKLKHEKGWDRNSVLIEGRRQPQLIIYNQEKVDGAIESGQIDPSEYARTIVVDTTKTIAPDVWHINFINSQAKERIDYPTQKPEALLERIINSSSNPGDIVLDCFAGSGTMGIVAEKLGRKWIMCDCGKLAIYIMQKRFFDMKEEIGNTGKVLKYSPFIAYNAGLYHDGDLLEKMKEGQYKQFVLELFGCQKREHKINGLDVHGTLNNQSVLVFNKHHYLTYEFIDDLHKTVGSSIKDLMYIIAPAGIVGFNEDYITKGSVKYVILRIPNSIIEFIQDKNFVRLTQPRSLDDINQTIDSIGFDFIYPPSVKAQYYQHNPRDKLLDKEYVIKIEEFEPIQIGSKIIEFEDSKSEALAMVMIDFNYDGETFNLDKYYFGDYIVKNDFSIKFDNEIGEKLMVIYLDIFGNERKEVIKKEKFIER